MILEYDCGIALINSIIFINILFDKKQFIIQCLMIIIRAAFKIQFFIKFSLNFLNYTICLVDKLEIVSETHL